MFVNALIILNVKSIKRDTIMYEYIKHLLYNKYQIFINAPLIYSAKGIKKVTSFIK
jgi:hypothetical protein